MSDVFSTISDTFLTSMGTEIFAKATNGISFISPILSAGFGLYLLLVALTYYNRGLDESLMDLTKRCMGWMLVIAFATNAGLYQKVANMVYELPEGMASVLVSGKYSASALDAAYDEFLLKLADLFTKINNLPWKDIGGRLSLAMGGLSMAIIGTLFFVIILALYLVAKLSLAMVILVGPIFIGAMLFPATRQWGMNWIGQVLNYAVTISFYVLLTTLQTAYFQSQISSLMNWPEVVNLTVFAPVLIQFTASTVIFVIVAWNVPSIASALTGGASVGGFGQFFNTVRQVASMATGMGAAKSLARMGGSIGKGK